MTFQEVRRALSFIEGSEDIYAEIAAEDIPHLERLLREGEPWQAERAVIAASRLQAPEAHSLLLEAAADTRPEVRVVAAASTGRIDPALRDQLLERLLEDSDPGVRRLSIRAVAADSSPTLWEKLGMICRADAVAPLRDLAAERMRELGAE